MASRLPALSPERAPASSQTLLSDVERRFGVAPDMYRIMAASPAALEAIVSFDAALGKGEMDSLTRERIVLAVAEANGCEYCLSAHTYRVRRNKLLDDAEITANRSGASNDIKADAAVRFAAKLARERGRVSDADVECVKQAGYSDAEIIEIIANVALTLFTNTINQALKTDIDFPRIAARREP